MRRKPAAAVTAALVAAIAAGGLSGASDAAKPVALTGKLTGFARPAIGTLDVLAVNANDGTIAAVKSPAGSSYRVSVAPGAYLVAVQVEDFKAGTSYGFSDVTSVGASGGQVGVAPGGPPAAAAAAPAVIVILPMNVTAADGSGLRSGSMQGEVIGGLFDKCHNGARYRLVDGNPKLINTLKLEQQLKDEGRVKADFQYNPLTAAYAISGSGSADANGNAIVDLTLTDLKTGKTLDHVKGRGDAKNIHDLIARFASGLAERDCHEGKPPGPKPRKPVAGHHSANGPFTATYEGHYVDDLVGNDGVRITTDLKFNAEITIRIKHGKVSSTTRTLTETGTFDTKGSNTPNAHCTLTASGPTSLPMGITPFPSRPGGLVDRLLVGMHLPAYIGPGQLKIAGDSGCNTISGTLYPHESGTDHPNWNAAVAPGPTILLKSLPHTKHYPGDYVDTYSGRPETVTLSATLSVR